MRDYLSKLIKRILEENPTTPPAEVWQNIGDGLDLNDVWNSVETQLDLDSVWHGVGEAIQHAHQIKWYDQFSYMSSAAVLLLTLTYATVNIGSTDEGPINAAQETPTLAFKSEGDDQSTPILAESPETERNISASGSFQNTSTNLLDSTDLLDELTDNSQADYPLPNIEVSTSSTLVSKAIIPVGARENSKPSISNVFRPKDIYYNTISEGRSVPDSVAFITKSLFTTNSSTRWYVGAIGSLKNNWLINSKTLNNFNSESLNSTSIDLNVEYGLLGGYELNKNFAVQLEAYIYSGEGQRYHEYIGGNYLPTSIDLKYQKIELLLKKKNRRLAAIGKNINTNYLFGIFIGHLSKATESVGDEILPLTDSFSKFNVGLIAGYELSYQLTNSWSLHPSIRLRYGLNSVYKDDPEEASFLRSSKTASIGFNVGVHYTIFN